MMKIRLSLLLVPSFIFGQLLVSSVVGGPFTCTFSGSKDSDSCTNTIDGSDHCVWCIVTNNEGEDLVDTTTTTSLRIGSTTNFNVCLSEVEAEALEQRLPTIHCDRYAGTDDDHNNTDDKKTTDDKVSPDTDDKVSPVDDTVPTDFWTCLQKNNGKECADADCTWCTNKGSFGVCMTGPAAESADHSDWFTCQKKEGNYDKYETVTIPTTLFLRSKPTTTTDHDVTSGVYDDLTCFVSYESEDICSSATAKNGQPCEWCSVGGITNLCLTSDQAAIGSTVGFSCHAAHFLKENVNVKDPYDTSCAIAYIEDQSRDGCTSTLDEDSNNCEYCTIAGSYNVCLTTDQASLAEQLGADCSEKSYNLQEQVEDPFDTSCMLAYLQDQSKGGCISSVDADGDSCEYCSLGGAYPLCLTSEQAGYGAQLGITCDEKGIQQLPVSAATNNDSKDNNNSHHVTSPYDPICAAAGMGSDDAESVCLGTLDMDGKQCVWCDAAGVFGLCLSSDQATFAGSILSCNSSETQIM